MQREAERETGELSELVEDGQSLTRLVSPAVTRIAWTNRVVRTASRCYLLRS